MMRLCEKYEVDVELHCKPIKGDWNGSGMHCNFSTKYLREVGGKEYFEALMKAFETTSPSTSRCMARITICA
jgi:glutamine synthetase